MSALVQQGRAPEHWLDRWRFANDGVFMAHQLSESRQAFELLDSSIQASDKHEKFVN
jgi:hypothetical protein